ncbi:helix-turn-helix domain-containing protein [Citrobacter amalonaticus]|uniref:winged helix-turn-helix domain-containing protein n=1 Tax=Citrobacter amalonaticus TaxID=35703 RepID=UPI001788B3A0|nr:helix-turn-helix domain-containing protein [Citrobacter amalonaticus]EKW2925359.1 winged helix-turn-helix domain-containing protein [Citrobacter amalonaticus]ELK6623807.1 winged helix-turn-helix domain-containing protein [Citrobacter amalonaticus]MBJ9257081.1 winged helix-turn-helix domain-containing protein [Citrobacter amalonaticus]MBJ9276031.1 winged helix-turn-helix domain-containing protein [Citrobacter amalonaticus]MCO4160204.1 helix-turn-helix domain-containing protein [Citrobacter a
MSDKGTSNYGVISDMHMNKLYGYLIDSSVLYLPFQQQLISNRGNSCQLRSTMSELMFFLMRHAERGIVSDDEIIFNVWEKNQLSGTYSRLWQVMQNLKQKLDEVGVENEMFIRVRGKGYYLMNDKITPLYTFDKSQQVKEISHANFSQI